MRVLGPRDRPPAALVALFDRDERALSWADTVDGKTVLATPRGLWWPDIDGQRRMLWQRIDKAIWRDGVLSVVEADVVDDVVLVDRAPVSVQLSRARDLPPTVRKRVEANIVRTELVTVPGGSVRFVARREPGRNGIRWWARLDPGTVDTQELHQAIRARITRLQGS